MLLKLYCRSRASLQCIQQRQTQEINGFQMRRVSRFRIWEHCPHGWIQTAAHMLTPFPTQCRSHLIHSSREADILPWYHQMCLKASGSSTAQDLPTSVSIGGSRDMCHTLSVSRMCWVVSKRPHKLPVLALANVGEHLLFHAGGEMRSRNILSDRNEVF